MQQALIVTIFTVPNFGSVLQTYATQCVVEQFGYKCRVLNYDHNRGEWAKGHGVPEMSFKSKVGNWLGLKAKHRKAKLLKKFVKSHIHLTSPYSTLKDMEENEGTMYDVYIIGSDQVWRPGYVQNVADFFLYQIDNNIKKYSYAASFGTDEWLFTEKETSICRDAIKYFLKISIRESSTIDLCYDKLGKKPEFVLDPTLLLDNKFYSGLIEKHESYREGKLCAYILNKKSLMPIVETYSKILDTSSVFPHSEVEDVSAPLDLRVVPSVSDWLDSIRSSQAVCTDSFHGMAFSIIFRKPFIVVVNKERGAARFFSLLNALNLEHRIVDESTDLNDLKPIDWGDVEDRLAKMQGQSIQFLKSIQ